MKKFANIFIEKFYWLLLAGIPFLPEYVLLKYHSAIVCNIDGICFRYGHPSLNSEGLAIVNMSITLLFPLCIWQLVGKHVLSRLSRGSFINDFRKNLIVILFGKFYFLIIANIPILFLYLFGTFKAPLECIEAGNCIDFYLPLDVPSSVAVLISCGLLWPMCFFKLFGKRITSHKEAP